MQNKLKWVEQLTSQLSPITQQVPWPEKTPNFNLFSFKTTLVTVIASSELMLFFFRLNNHKMAGCLSTPLYLHLPLPSWCRPATLHCSGQQGQRRLGGGLPQDWNPVWRIWSTSDAWPALEWRDFEKAGEGQGVDPFSQLLPTTSVFSQLRQVGLDSLAAASSINLVHFDF